MWGEVIEVRKMMDERGLIKKPGLSWIDIKREVHVFLVGDTSHPRYDEIHHYLHELLKRMKEEGYVPDTNFVLHDVEEEQKEQNLSYHSEKLAVAFGIISTPPGTPIKSGIQIGSIVLRAGSGHVEIFGDLTHSVICKAFYLSRITET
ncbi:pentatricopeptide repeat-containing protein [Pyrus ussuriensis x Pyrus communis]|uniref:Pentatricopeptide repeat-containing protein n=1 Tax=Pyrus ussuriensis x Pyrus communis TaxID=2448454 RepID=A0A5N5GRK0_9ROSA|nr:pentatricopeptide repeat-containing protein [Pyrus ussuriensis x Pyrus communis]